jgi:hypothetical protein
MARPVNHWAKTVLYEIILQIFSLLVKQVASVLPNVSLERKKQITQTLVATTKTGYRKKEF